MWLGLIFILHCWSGIMGRVGLLLRDGKKPIVNVLNCAIWHQSAFSVSSRWWWCLVLVALNSDQNENHPIDVAWQNVAAGNLDFLIVKKPYNSPPKRVVVLTEGTAGFSTLHRRKWWCRWFFAGGLFSAADQSHQCFWDQGNTHTHYSLNTSYSLCLWYWRNKLCGPEE